MRPEMENQHSPEVPRIGSRPRVIYQTPDLNNRGSVLDHWFP